MIDATWIEFLNFQTQTKSNFSISIILLWHLWWMVSKFSLLKTPTIVHFTDEKPFLFNFLLLLSLSLSMLFKPIIIIINCSFGHDLHPSFFFFVHHLVMIRMMMMMVNLNLSLQFFIIWVIIIDDEQQQQQQQLHANKMHVNIFFLKYNNRYKCA